MLSIKSFFILDLPFSTSSFDSFRTVLGIKVLEKLSSPGTTKRSSIRPIPIKLSGSRSIGLIKYIIAIAIINFDLIGNFYSLESSRLLVSHFLN